MDTSMKKMIINPSSVRTNYVNYTYRAVELYNAIYLIEYVNSVSMVMLTNRHPTVLTIETKEKYNNMRIG